MPPGSSMLLEDYWLDLEGVPVAVTRAPDLGAVLSQGMEALAAYEWVVVPEIHVHHPTPRQLGFVRRFQGSYGFRGPHGHDYEVYAVPRLPVTARPR